jgi:hypothetical protein
MASHPVSIDRRQDLELPQAANMLLEECRMVLPGIQALFGFQLIAVFNQGFGEKLSSFDQHLHLVAIALSVVSAGLVMGPASYHRQTAPMQMSDHFMRVASRLLLWSMLPLALSVCIDLYIVSCIIVEPAISVILALAALAFLGGVWVWLPRSRRARPPRGADTQP